MSHMMLPDPLDKFVVINIDFVNERIRVDKEKAEVRVGQKIVWRVADFIVPPARTMLIYFRGDSPFRWPEEIKHLGAVGSRNPDGSSTRELIATPERPGDYKYGIRFYAHDDTLLDDEDPYLIVLPRFD